MLILCGAALDKCKPIHWPHHCTVHLLSLRRSKTRMAMNAAKHKVPRYS